RRGTVVARGGERRRQFDAGICGTGGELGGAASDGDRVGLSADLSKQRGIGQPVPHVVGIGRCSGRKFIQPPLAGALDVRDQRWNRLILRVQRRGGAIESQCASVVKGTLLVSCVAFDKGWSRGDIWGERGEEARGPAPTRQTRFTVTGAGRGA